jgi:hypothetical protein
MCVYIINDNQATVFAPFGMCQQRKQKCRKFQTSQHEGIVGTVYGDFNTWFLDQWDIAFRGGSACVFACLINIIVPTELWSQYII